MIIILWAVLFISVFIPLGNYGIRPRAIAGLPGILLAPFLHANMDHLIANSISLLVLGTLFLSLEKKLSAVLLMHFIILGGIGTWLIGRPEYVHIGASGVIYAVFGYLLFIGFFMRRVSMILVSVIVFVLYSGMIWGVLPGDKFISWESHLCGFLSGIITARLYANSRR